MVGLNRYKWYQSQTPGDMPVKGVDTRGVPARTLGPEGGGLGSHINWKKGTSVNKDAGHEGG